MKTKNILATMLVISLSFNIYMFTVKESIDLDQKQEAMEYILKENESLKVNNSDEIRGEIRRLNIEFINAMYTNRSTEVQKKIEQMQPLMTTELLEKYKKETNFDETLPSIESEIYLSNTMLPATLKTTIEKDIKNPNRYIATSTFEMETEIRSKERTNLISTNMLTSFAFIQEEDIWKVDQFIWNHAMTTAYQKF